MFNNRAQAGKLLAEKLLKYKDEKAVVLAIPRGGLPLGAIIAKTLHLPLDIVLTKKIGHPYNKEYAIGALSLDNIVLGEAAKEISRQYITEESKLIRQNLQDRYQQYYQNKTPEKIEGKIAIIVDDGIATGNTILATVGLITKSKPSKIVIAVPVAPPTTVKKLESSSHIHEVLCLLTPPNFQAVGQFYNEFYPVSDKEAIAFLQSSQVDKV
ncbi:phosphoribosyltransferase [Abyssalbus ytuae]|uniref:Phosphoribosyltransferase n=1 Tax=Abyssalbus ytuae TaxID=2926907 RepID=A0A9E6ZW70_9FLAO|nr:phosphoribosyltransferase family protein [Abyssalbus ytuae]UOB17926.1 phosphoribosyltransferase [Abyssalbus ytuae]